MVAHDCLQEDRRKPPYIPKFSRQKGRFKTLQMKVQTLITNMGNSVSNYIDQMQVKRKRKQRLNKLAHLARKHGSKQSQFGTSQRRKRLMACIAIAAAKDADSDLLCYENVARCVK